MADGGPDGDGWQAVIDQQITGIWRASEVAESDIQNLGYDFTRRRTNSRCSELPEDERWFAMRRSIATVGAGNEQRAVDAVSRWLDKHGYTTYVYRAPAGGYLVDGLDEDRGLNVTFNVQRGGAASVLVDLTPCVAGPYEPPDPGVWTPVDA